MISLHEGNDDNFFSKGQLLLLFSREMGFMGLLFVLPLFKGTFLSSDALFW